MANGTTLKPTGIPAAFAWMLCLVTVLGCSSPSPTVRIAFAPDPAIQKYNKVHIVPPSEDSRHLQLRVLTRLRSLGFEADVVERAKELYDRQGSGFLITSNGHVLTCAHVISGRGQATAWLSGVRYRAEVVKVDVQNDLALLRIAMTNEPPVVPLGLSSKTNDTMGKDVFTIGFPMTDILGSAPRLTKGVISATVGLQDNPDYLQISAAIQPGNSGGPLFNEAGEVIGIVNSTLNPIAVMRRTGGNLPQTVNFALKGAVIEKFLERAQVVPRAKSLEAVSPPMDSLQKSVALLSAGWTAEGDAQKEMVCRFGYATTSRSQLKLKFFAIEFSDLKSGKSLFRTGSLAEDRDKPEDVMLDAVFKKVQHAFKP